MAYIISSGESSNGIILKNDSMTVLDGGIVTTTTVNSDGWIEILNAGKADSTTINPGGNMRISSGGTANSTTVNSNGKITVFSSGTANSTTINNAGYLFISSGGTACGVSTGLSGFVDVWGYMENAYLSGGNAISNATIHPGGVLSSAKVVDGVDLYVSGAAFDIILDEGKENGDLSDLYLLDGGYAEKIVVNQGGNYIIHSGTTGVSNTVNYGGKMEVFSGGTANSTTVSNGGLLYIYSGGTALDLKCVPFGAIVSAEDGAHITYASLNGVYYGSGGYLASHARVLNSVTVSSYYGMHVLSGGTANDTAINGKGWMLVSSGGIANRTANCGVLNVYSGGTANNTSVSYGELYIANNGVANNTMVNKGGIMYVSIGAVVNRTTVDSSGSMIVLSGGIVNDTTVKPGEVYYYAAPYGPTSSATTGAGKLYVSSGGVVVGVTVTSFGVVHISSGGTMTGKMSFESQANVWIYEGAILNFYPTQATSDALVNDLSLVQGDPLYTLTISDTLESGVYTLAKGASWFEETITVMSCTGSELGTITVGETLNTGNGFYSLSLNQDELAIKIHLAPKIFLSANNETPVQSATLTATSNSEGDIFFSIDKIQWTKYEHEIIVTNNMTYYFKTTDNEGYTGTNSISFSNIDRTPPEKPYASADIITPTKGNVVVSATFSEDTDRKEYSFDKQTWKIYVNGVTMTENSTVYFRGTDAAGNVSESTEFEVANIDKTPPEKPVAFADITTPTNGDVMVSATFSNDSTTKQYSMNGQTWSAYEDAVRVTTNSMVYFRGIDEAGNISEITRFEVGNIDKIAPDKPVAAADIATPTNGNVFVSATFSEDSLIKEYSIDDQEWSTYFDAVRLTENGIVRFRATDGVGNVSEITSYEVANIDKIAPDKPTALADVKKNTNGEVFVSAIFTKDSFYGEYSLNGGPWTTYADAIRFSENGYVSFRGTDEAGNVSEEETYTVLNIVEPDNEPDNGKENDVLYDKKTGWNDAIPVSNTITGNSEIDIDMPASINQNGYHNMFGNNGTNVDTGDVAQISVDTSAKLTFQINSTAAGTFYVYRDGVDKKGNRKLITVGKVSVKKDKTAILKNVCLSATGKYYVAMTAKNVKKAGTEGLYNVNVVESIFFVDAEEGECKNNTANAGKTISIGRGLDKNIVLDGNPMTGSADFNSFVGFTDSADYAKLDLTSSAYLKFIVTGDGDGKAKFTLWKQVKGTTGKLSKVTSVSLPAKKKYEAMTKAQFLDTSKYTYYVSMECTDEAKGNGLYYNVEVTDDTVFFDSADDGRNNVLYDKKAKAYYFEDVKHHFESTTIGANTKVKLDSDPVAETEWENFVGYQDAIDYAKIELTSTGDLTLMLEATGDATFTIYKKGQDKKGHETLEAIQATKLTVASGANKTERNMLISGLDAGEYYVSMAAKTTKATDKGCVFYNVTATFTASASASLAMPETDSLGISDALSFGSYDTDALADASASALADLDDKSGWQSLLA